MPGQQHKSPEASFNRDRLNGWKEISNYLGKSVRTSQRWERQLAMPVHRIHTPRGEIIFASKLELDRWHSSKERAANPALRAVPEEVTLDWLASLPEPEFLRLVRSGRIPRAVLPELICQACLTLHANGVAAEVRACKRVLELISSLPKSRHPSIARQARAALARRKQPDSK